jgi:hypothetical protein
MEESSSSAEARHLDVGPTPQEDEELLSWAYADNDDGCPNWDLLAGVGAQFKAEKQGTTS